MVFENYKYLGNLKKLKGYFVKRGRDADIKNATVQ
jgi:hypothetical protein